MHVLLKTIMRSVLFTLYAGRLILSYMARRMRGDRATVTVLLAIGAKVTS